MLKNEQFTSYIEELSRQTLKQYHAASSSSSTVSSITNTGEDVSPMFARTVLALDQRVTGMHDHMVRNNSSYHVYYVVVVVAVVVAVVGSDGIP